MKVWPVVSPFGFSLFHIQIQHCYLVFLWDLPWSDGQYDLLSLGYTCPPPCSPYSEPEVPLTSPTLVSRVDPNHTDLPVWEVIEARHGPSGHLPLGREGLVRSGKVTHIVSCYKDNSSVLGQSERRCVTPRRKLSADL